MGPGAVMLGLATVADRLVVGANATVTRDAAVGSTVLGAVQDNAGTEQPFPDDGLAQRETCFFVSFFNRDFH